MEVASREEAREGSGEDERGVREHTALRALIGSLLFIATTVNVRSGTKATCRDDRDCATRRLLDSATGQGGGRTCCCSIPFYW